MSDLSLREAIDACRAGSSDLTEPEFAELAQHVASDDQVRHAYGASQVFDAALRESLESVAAPAGLADRLLLATRSLDKAETDDAVGTVMLPAPRRSSSWSQAFELVAPTVVILAVAAAMFAVVFHSLNPPMSSQQLVDRSFEWKEQLDHEKWNEGLKGAPREEFPLGSRAVIAPWRWQRVSTGGAEMVVYSGGPPQVLLFVVRSQTKVTGLSNSPMLLSSTGGWSVGAWQSGDLTYVLVVEGDRRKFESHLKSHTPV